MNAANAAPAVWFTRCGAPPSAAERALAQAWIDALGGAPSLRFVADWDEAATWLRAHRFAEAHAAREDATRGELRRRAQALLGEREMLQRLTAATQPLLDPLREAAAAAAARAGGDDEGMIRAAAGAAALAEHQRALAALAGAPPAHPFFCQQRLFAHGRWPLGVFADAGAAVAAIF
jgi:hypothetical protein